MGSGPIFALARNKWGLTPLFPVWCQLLGRSAEDAAVADDLVPLGAEAVVVDHVAIVAHDLGDDGRVVAALPLDHHRVADLAALRAGTDDEEGCDDDETLEHGAPGLGDDSH